MPYAVRSDHAHCPSHSLFPLTGPKEGDEVEGARGTGVVECGAFTQGIAQPAAAQVAGLHERRGFPTRAREGKVSVVACPHNFSTHLGRTTALPRSRFVLGDVCVWRF